ncbi:hypothetical protein D3C72_387340 [compost metagenome]
MEQLLVSMLIAVAALLAGRAFRWRRRRRLAQETARLVEAERIVALLSARQPGVWDQDELRSRVEGTARDLWSLPTRDAMAPLAMWIAPSILNQHLDRWPARAERREVRLRMLEPASFVQVQEGGEQDRLVARLRAQWEAIWHDARGRVIRRERRAAFRTYHAWVHIDGQGWQLTAISTEPPLEEPAPSSVACRIMPQDAAEGIGR